MIAYDAQKLVSITMSDEVAAQIAICGDGETSAEEERGEGRCAGNPLAGVQSGIDGRACGSHRTIVLQHYVRTKLSLRYCKTMCRPS